MKLNKFIIIFLIIFLLVVGVLFVISLRGGRIFGGGNQVTIGGEKVHVRIADDPQERQIGLSETAKLGDKEGMLFLFDKKGYPSFWMKGMEFPIDIIYLNDTKVVTIYKNVQPPKSEDEMEMLPTYPATNTSNRVLEVPAGFADKHGVKVGDTVTFSL